MSEPLHHDYHYSGLDSQQAMNHFERHCLGRFPRFMRGFLRRHLAFGIVCDGCGERVVMKRPLLLPDGHWLNTDWVHRAHLDFCFTCQSNGTADRAVADGVKPLGAYTLGNKEN